MLITLLGPTASGKTSLAVKLSQLTGAEIISADSRQVYRGMDIGTGKDLSEYAAGGNPVAYHLIDVAEAGEEFNLFRFRQLADYCIDDIFSRGRHAVLCGGTGLYIESVLRNFRIPDVPVDSDFRKSIESKSDEELVLLLKSYKTPHNQTDTDTRRRLVRALEIARVSSEKCKGTTGNEHTGGPVFGLMLPRDVVRERISFRLKQRIDNGMIEEVETLIKKGVDPGQLIRYGLEYKYITLYLTGKMNRDEMVKLLNIAIHQFSKRQMTWFRGMERRGITIHWINGMLPHESLVQTMCSLMEKFQK